MEVRGVDPAARTPRWMARRLALAGMRPISLIVDVTNYVMLDLGQPLHAYDAEKVVAPIIVRRAREGEDRKSTRVNASHVAISYAVFCLQKNRKKPDRLHALRLTYVLPVPGRRC